MTDIVPPSPERDTPKESALLEVVQTKLDVLEGAITLYSALTSDRIPDGATTTLSLDPLEVVHPLPPELLSRLEDLVDVHIEFTSPMKNGRTSLNIRLIDDQDTVLHITRDEHSRPDSDFAVEIAPHGQESRAIGTVNPPAINTFLAGLIYPHETDNFGTFAEMDAQDPVVSQAIIDTLKKKSDEVMEDQFYTFVAESGETVGYMQTIVEKGRLVFIDLGRRLYSRIVLINEEPVLQEREVVAHIKLEAGSIGIDFFLADTGDNASSRQVDLDMGDLLALQEFIETQLDMAHNPDIVRLDDTDLAQHRFDSPNTGA